MLCYAVVWYGMVWYEMAWYGLVWYGMVWNGQWCGMVRYGMVCTVWYGVAWCGLVYYTLVCCFAVVWFRGIDSSIIQKARLLPAKSRSVAKPTSANFSSSPVFLCSISSNTFCSWSYLRAAWSARSRSFNSWGIWHHGNMYLTSLPFVSVRRHGYVTSVKVETKISSQV